MQILKAADPCVYRDTTTRKRGAYYITICVQNLDCLFGEVVDGVMRLNTAGLLVRECWLAIPDHFPHIQLDAFVIMPNHVHGILLVTAAAHADIRANGYSPLQHAGPEDHRGGTFRSPSRTIGSVVPGFKIGVTKWFRANTATVDVWQRNYYEHIIRDEDSLNRIRQYILDNPIRWERDHDNIQDHL